MGKMNCETQGGSAYIKCRFCNWTTAKKFTAKDGKFKGIDKAHQRLLDHVFLNHHGEWDAIQSALQEQEDPRYGQDEG